MFSSSAAESRTCSAALRLAFSHWPETELFAAAPTARRRKKQEQVSDVEALIKDLSELNIGDPVVHTQHGIGRYKGLVNMDLGQGSTEFLHLEYADKAALYVPVSQL